VEFRYFLLYAGPYVLKGVVNDDIYRLFMVLHYAITTLISPNITKSKTQFSRELLKYFILAMAQIVGQEWLIFNVHCLYHLPDDCDHFEAPLDVFSSFTYEAKFGKMKNVLRGRRLPLAQILKRRPEEDNLPIGTTKSSSDLFKRKSLQEAIKPNSQNDIFVLLNTAK